MPAKTKSVKRVRRQGCGTEAADGQAGAVCGENGVLCPGCAADVAEEAQRQAAEATLKQRIGRLVVPEAQFGVMFPVTPFIAWDNGEISGPYDNWRHAPLTAEHLLIAVEALSTEQRAVFFAEALARMQGER